MLNDWVNLVLAKDKNIGFISCASSDLLLWSAYVGNDSETKSIMSKN